MNSRTSPIVSHLGLAADCGLRDDCVSASTYSDVEAEYWCVRSRVGISDLNHYAKLHISGDMALELLNHVILIDLARLAINQLQTTAILDDDAVPCGEAFIINYGDHFLLLAEAVSSTALFARLLALVDSGFAGTIVTDQTEERGLLGLDGPYSWELLKSFLGISVIGTRYMEMVPDQVLNGVPFTLCRTGKTGEYGYLLLTASDKVSAIWDDLRELGKRFEMLPIGYLAIDLCKLENRFFSQHNEGSHVDNVLELNTRVLVSRDKGDYAGSEKIEDLLDNGQARHVIGLTFAENGDVEDTSLKAGDLVFCDDNQIGTLVNLGYSYTLERWIGLALVEADYSCVGLDYTVATAGGGWPARTVSAPFIFNRSLEIRPQEDSYFN